MIDALLNVALPLLLAATTDAAAVPTMHVAADTVRADDGGAWSLTFTIHNPGQLGLYGDSLFVDITDLDPGLSRAPRRSTQSYPAFARSAGTAGAGEDKPAQFSIPATCERAKIRLRLFEHDGSGRAYAFRDSLLAGPAALTDQLSSTFLTVKGRRVEIVIAAAAGGADGAKPGVLMVPSETAHARTLARTASQLAARGVNVVVVSPPGYGQSEGPADMAGPATLAALGAALAKLAALPGTDHARLAVWGTGRGATAALLLAARHPEIARVVAQDADYDLWAGWRAADAATAANLAAEAGPDSAGWKARSPLLAPTSPRTRLLVIQGAQSDAPAAATRAFVAARLAAGAAVDTLYASPATRRLARNPVRAAIEFLTARGQE